MAQDNDFFRILLPGGGRGIPLSIEEYISGTGYEEFLSGIDQFPTARFFSDDDLLYFDKILL